MNAWLHNMDGMWAVFVAFDRALVTTGKERGEEVAKATAVEICQQTGSERQCEVKPKPKVLLLHSTHHCPSEAR